MSPKERIAEARRLQPIYEEAVRSLDDYLRTIESGNLKPQEVDRLGHSAVRFVDKIPEEALLLKFARLVSLNKVLLILISTGFVQEQGIIQRCIEETNEDILFISANVTKTSTSEKFERFLEEFWKEDFADPADPSGTLIPRWFSRKGITAFLNRIFPLDDPSLADRSAKAIQNMYSGFVHGAAPQILELYDLSATRFMTDGLVGTNRHLDYVFDAKNSIYRSLCSASIIGKAFGSQELFEIGKAAVVKFETDVGEGAFKFEVG